MKAIKLLLLVAILFVASCNNAKENKKQPVVKIENSQSFSETKRIEIVKYYLINKRNLLETDFHKIIFLNDVFDGVKVMHYKGRDAFFCFKFSEALIFYNNNNNNNKIIQY